MHANYLMPLFLPQRLIAKFGENHLSSPYVSQSFKEPNAETLMLIPSERCNLKCAYCYERQKNPQRMDIQTAKAAVENAFLRLRPYKSLKIEFRGGEPFLEFAFIKELCEWVIKNFQGRSFFFYAVTNGTCFTDEIKTWLQLHKEIFVAPLSIDGTRATHNHNRSNSFDLIDFDFIFRTWNHPYTYTTISPENAANIFRELRFLMDKGFEIRANIEFAQLWSDGQLENLAKGFRRLADYVLDRRCANRINLLSRNGFLDYDCNSNEDAREGRKHFLACNAGKYRRLVAADGKIYPCHAFVPSVFNMSDKSTDVNFFDRLKTEELHPQQCCSCNFFYLCHICPGFSYGYAGDFKWRNPSICAITKIRAFLAAYYWGLRLCNKTNDDVPGDANVILARIADLYRGEKVYE